MVALKNTGDVLFGAPWVSALATVRDAPLTFAWRTAQSEMAALELRPAQNWRHDDARNAVLTEAALAASHDRAVSYSRRKAHYVGRQRYYGPSYAYRTILPAVSDGVAAGLLEEQRARPGSRERQSRFRATSRLCQLLKNSPAEFRPGQEVIWLRDSNGRLIDYQDCPLTDRLRQELKTINRQRAPSDSADPTYAGTAIGGLLAKLITSPRLRVCAASSVVRLSTWGDGHTAPGNLCRRAIAR